MSWLSRLLGRKTLSDALREVEAETLAAPAAPSGPRLPDRPDAAPEDWAAALGVTLAVLEAAEPAPPSPAEVELAQAVLAHFDAHRPGPASFPSIALKILDLVRDPRVDAGALARNIEQDPALSAGVLVLANSAVFRGLDKIETVREAVTRLGLGEVARLAAALSTRSLFRAGVRAEFELFGPVWNRLYYHGATVARAASELARARQLGEPDRVFLGGMLHDVGKSIALRSVAALELEDRIPRLEASAVDRLLHQVHVQVGAEAHREWGLPPGLASLAEFHHLPEIEAGPAQAELHLVRLVSALELHRSSPGISPSALPEALDSARALGLGPARVAALLATLAETGDWVRMVFGEESGGPAAAR
ncbi:MAG: HDOD domain-containing protein [Anaeromyxobacter sp.]